MKRMTWPFALTLFSLILFRVESNNRQRREMMKQVVKGAAIGALVSNTQSDVTNLMDYVKTHGITPKNPHLYLRVLEMKDDECPSFCNNFEITRISFMQRPEVVQWHEAWTELPPFGVFRNRWGDAVERFITMT